MNTNKVQLNYKTVRIPISGLRVHPRTDGEKPDQGKEWSAFCTVLLEQFKMVTRAANASIIHLLRNDYTPQEAHEIREKQRTATTEEKVAFAYPREVNLYEFMRGIAPDMDTQSAATISRKVQAEYYKKRRNFLLQLSERPPFYQFPFPIICPRGSLTSPNYQFQFDGKNMILRVKLGRLNEKPRVFELYLDSGEGHAYGRAAIEKVIMGERKSGSLQIELRPAQKGDKRPTLALRDKNRNTKYYRIQLAVPIDFPKKSSLELNATEKPLILYTDKAHFLEAQTAFSVVWILDQDHVRRRLSYFSPETILKRIKDYDERRLRVANDIKFQARAGFRSGARSLVQDLAAHQNNWLGTWVHQTISRLMDYVKAQHITVVYYNDSVKDFIPHFPWFKLKANLEIALADEGVCFCDIDRPPEGKTYADQITALKAAMTVARRKNEQVERERREPVLLAQH
jgi:hypothetical protein